MGFIILARDIRNILFFGRIFLPFALGYFLSNIFRSINAVVSTNLESELLFTASDIGLLTSAYFFAFACFQLPLGLLLDHFGPRRIQSIMLLCASVGSVLFALGSELVELTLGRALIGLGLSGCLMASFKAFSLWFENHRLPIVNGYLMACGGLGAMTATVPVEGFLATGSWRDLFYLLACICVITAVFVWYVVPERSISSSDECLSDQLDALKAILKSKPFFVVAPLAFCSHGLGLAVTTLWAGPWLRDVAGFDTTYTAQVLLLLMIAITAGSAVWGVLAHRMYRSGISSSSVITVGGLLFLITNIIVCTQISMDERYIWIAYGFTLTSGSLLYSCMTAIYPNKLAGRVNTALNLVVFIGAFVYQWGFGIVIDYWQSLIGGSLAQGYQAAFAIAIAFQMISIIWFYFGRKYLTGSDTAAS